MSQTLIFNYKLVVTHSRGCLDKRKMTTYSKIVFQNEKYVNILFKIFRKLRMILLQEYSKCINNHSNEFNIF